MVISITMRMRWTMRGTFPMEHIQGFSRSHWMPPLGECSQCIAAAAALVDDFSRKHKTLTKHYF